MVIQSVTFTGSDGQRSATISRERSELTISSLCFSTIHLGPHATKEKIWAVATKVQAALDCDSECGSDIEPYNSLISEMLQSLNRKVVAQR